MNAPTPIEMSSEKLEAALSRFPRDRAMSVLRRARSLFDTFLAKAGARPQYATEVRLAKQRVRGSGAGPLSPASGGCPH